MSQQGFDDLSEFRNKTNFNDNTLSNINRVLSNNQEVQRKAYDIAELKKISDITKIPLDKLPVSAIGDAQAVLRLQEDYDRIIKQQIRAKNYISKSDYGFKWLELHERLDVNDPDYEYKLKRRKELSIEFMDSFLTDHPIYIHEDGNIDNILVTIPPMYMHVSTIQGEESNHIDAYTHSCKDNSRPDISRDRGISVIKSMHNAQPINREKIEKMRLMSLKASIDVLRLYNIDHPFLKQIEEMEKKQNVTNNKTNNVTTENNNEVEEDIKFF